MLESLAAIPEQGKAEANLGYTVTPSPNKRKNRKAQWYRPGMLDTLETEAGGF